MALRLRPTSLDSVATVRAAPLRRSDLSFAYRFSDLAQDSHNSLIALSCLRPTWERIKSKTLESAPYRYSTVLQFRPIPSSEVGEALIAAYFDRAYKRVEFRPPYPTWPIKPTAFQDAQDYTPRQLIELSEAHVRKCRQTGAIIELGAFASADRPPVQELPEPTEPIELSSFASLDADFAAARKAAATDGALDEARVDARLPALLQAGLSAWIDENNLSGTFSVDGLPCRNPPLHARLRQVINLDLEEEIHWSLRAIVNTHHTAALT